MRCNFGPNWDQTAGISLLVQEIKSPALAKNLLILSPTTMKNPPLLRLPHQRQLSLKQISKLPPGWVYKIS